MTLAEIPDLGLVTPSVRTESCTPTSPPRGLSGEHLSQSLPGAFAQVDNHGLVLVEELHDIGSIHVGQRDEHLHVPAGVQSAGVAFREVIVSVLDVVRSTVCDVPHFARIEGQARAADDASQARQHSIRPERVQQAVAERFRLPVPAFTLAGTGPPGSADEGDGRCVASVE